MQERKNEGCFANTNEAKKSNQERGAVQREQKRGLSRHKSTKPVPAVLAIADTGMILKKRLIQDGK